MSKITSRTMSRTLSTKQIDRINQLFDQIEAKSISREEAYQTLLRVFEYLPKDDLAEIEKDFKDPVKDAEPIFLRLQALLLENSNVAKFGNGFKEQFTKIFRKCYDSFILQNNDKSFDKDTNKRISDYFVKILSNFMNVVVLCKDIRWILKEFERYFVSSDLPYHIKEVQVEKAKDITSRDNYYYLKRLSEDGLTECESDPFQWVIDHVNTSRRITTYTDRKIVDPNYNRRGEIIPSDNWFIKTRHAFNTNEEYRKTILSSLQNHRPKPYKRVTVFAAKLGIPEIFELALKKGVYNSREQPVNSTDELTAALEHEYLEIVKLIIKHEEETIVFTPQQFESVTSPELLNFMRKHNGLSEIPKELLCMVLKDRSKEKQPSRQNQDNRTKSFMYENDICLDLKESCDKSINLASIGNQVNQLPPAFPAEDDFKLVETLFSRIPRSNAKPLQDPYYESVEGLSDSTSSLWFPNSRSKTESKLNMLSSDFVHIGTLDNNKVLYLEKYNCYKEFTNVYFYESESDPEIVKRQNPNHNKFDEISGNKCSSTLFFCKMTDTLKDYLGSNRYVVFYEYVSVLMYPSIPMFCDSFINDGDKLDLDSIAKSFDRIIKDDDNIDIQKESKEKEFVKSTIHSLEESVKGKTFSGPFQAGMSMFKSGVFTDMCNQLHSGNFDISKVKDAVLKFKDQEKQHSKDDDNTDIQEELKELGLEI
jgi:hypothetical protein